MSLIMMLILLIGAHFMADFPLQHKFMYRSKNRYRATNRKVWVWAMCAHASIHMFFVAWITNVWYLALMEFVVHAIVDDARCKRSINFTETQLIHLASKVVWVFIAFLHYRG